jgi:hypothetical protein
LFGGSGGFQCELEYTAWVVNNPVQTPQVKDINDQGAFINNQVLPAEMSGACFRRWMLRYIVFVLLFHCFFPFSFCSRVNVILSRVTHKRRSGRIQSLEKKIGRQGRSLPFADTPIAYKCF